MQRETVQMMIQCMYVVNVYRNIALFPITRFIKSNTHARACIDITLFYMQNSSGYVYSQWIWEYSMIPNCALYYA